MKLDKLKTVDKILGSGFPTHLLEALVELDDHVLKLEVVASEKPPDEDEQVVIVQDMLQQAGAVIQQFRKYWAVYEEDVPETLAMEAIRKEYLPEQGTAGDNDDVDCVVMDCDKEDHSECEDKEDATVQDKAD